MKTGMCVFLLRVFHFISFMAFTLFLLQSYLALNPLIIPLRFLRTFCHTFFCFTPLLLYICTLIYGKTTLGMKSKNIIWILVTILLSAAAVTGIWWYSRSMQKDDPRSTLLALVPDYAPLITVIDGKTVLENAGYTDYQPGTPIDFPFSFSALKAMVGSTDANVIKSLFESEGLNLNAMILTADGIGNDSHIILMTSVTDRNKISASFNNIENFETSSCSQGKIWSVNENYIFYLPDSEDVMCFSLLRWIEKSNGEYGPEDPEDAAASLSKFINSAKSKPLASWKHDYLVRSELTASALIDFNSIEEELDRYDAETYRNIKNMLDASWNYIGLQATLDNQSLTAAVNALDANGRFTDLTKMDVSCMRTPLPTDNSVGFFIPVRNLGSSEDFRYVFAQCLVDMLYKGSERSDYWNALYPSDEAAAPVDDTSRHLTEDQVFIYKTLKDNLENINSFAWRMDFSDSSFDIQEQLQFTYESSAFNFYNTLYNNPVPYFRKDSSDLKIYNPGIYGNQVDLLMTHKDTYVWFGKPMEDHLQGHPLAFAYANLSRSDLSSLAQGFSPKFGIKSSCTLNGQAAVLHFSLTETDKTILENFIDTLKLISNLL